MSNALATQPRLSVAAHIDPSSWRVLIVEPDAGLAATFRKIVSNSSSFQVAGVVSRGEDALAFTRRHRCDLLLLDLRIAGMSGMELLDRMRMDGCTAEVIVISSSRSSETVRAMLHRGAVDYVVKPVEAPRLRQAFDLFVNRVQALGCEFLDQQAIDQACASGRLMRPTIPKGLTEDGVLRVRQALTDSSVPLSSAEVAEATGLARVTARRYLEHLVTTDQAIVEAWPTGPGRPRKLYRPAVL